MQYASWARGDGSAATPLFLRSDMLYNVGKVLVFMTHRLARGVSHVETHLGSLRGT